MKRSPNHLLHLQILVLVLASSQVGALCPAPPVQPLEQDTYLLPVDLDQFSCPDGGCFEFEEEACAGSSCCGLQGDDLYCWSF
ncbi:MAG: hypothetical protein KC561_12255, partial [Myxococcales bacterium]|nr:hypothetical protein [Myxococcales bacterium]